MNYSRLFVRLTVPSRLCHMEVKKNPPYTQEYLDTFPTVDFSLSNATPEDISYHLFSRADQAEGQILTKHNINEALIDKETPTKVFIHGLIESKDTPWYRLLKDEYFKKGMHNIIEVDWSRQAQNKYKFATRSVKFLGEHTADFLVNSEIPHDKIHLIGFSLGCHLAGFVGKHLFQLTGCKISRITALDPARSGFEKIGMDQRISFQDANFVDVVHTDMNWLSLNDAIGHVDFYPNGGKNQPGCVPHEIDQFANHVICTNYFIRSVRQKFKVKRARLLKNENRIEVLGSKEEDDVIFGDGVSRYARGVFYVEIKPELFKSDL